MKIEQVTDAAFAPYGRVIPGYEVTQLLRVLETETPLPENTAYVPNEPALERLLVAKKIQSNLYGGLPLQFGWCNGHNTKLNCLEYHRSSEVNLGAEDFILLVAAESDIVDGVLDTAKVRAFRCPKGVLLEVYATTLHYAPCSAAKNHGFKVMVVLPEGTNTDKPHIEPLNSEDKLLWACNKWLLAHQDSAEAAQGAAVCLQGVNIDIEKDL